MRSMLLVAIALLVPAARLAGEDLPLLFSEDFEKGAERWQPTDAAAWKIEKLEGNAVFSQFNKASNYKPPHRAPLNMALIKDLSVGDFVLTAKVKSTIPDYDHRDACVFFGYQAPGKLYYVHFGKKADDRANQIFIVDGADRKKISTTSTAGTPWTDNWHTVRVVRTVADGKIAIYFDDLEKPVMTATDKTFASGQVGVGSFDDTTMWDDVQVRGVKAEKP